MRDWVLKYRRILIVATVLIAILAGSWRVFASQVGQAVQDTLIQRWSQQLQGRIQVGTIDVSLAGWVRVRDVSLYNQHGVLLAQAPIVEIQYQWSDLKSGKLSLPNIETVTLQGSEFWFQEEADSHWNWEGLFKDPQPEDSTFKGKLIFESGKLHISAASLSRTIEEMNGSLDFSHDPDLAVTMKGKLDQALLNVDGRWGGSGSNEMTIQTGNLDLAGLRDLLPSTQELRLEGGRLSNVIITVRRNDKGTVQWQADGEFVGLSLAGKPAIREGQGKFHSDEAGVQFQDLSLLISNQQVVGEGNISWQDGKELLDFSLNAPDVDPEAIASGLAVQRPISVIVRVAGKVLEPEVSGSFSIPQVTFSSMPVNGVVGTFRHTGNSLLLQQVSGAAYGGEVTAEGEVWADGERYEMAVAGQGMNSSRLTDKDVQGPLDFTGHVSGQGETAVTRGNFVIHNGRAYGIAFQSMTGAFVKRGSVTDISGIALQTSLGTFYPEQLSREAMDQLNGRQLPVSQEAIKRAVTDEIVKRLFH